MNDLRLIPLDCGHFTDTERSAHQYLTGFGEKVVAQMAMWVVTGGDFPVVVDLPTSHPDVVRERFGRTLFQTPEQRPLNALAAAGIDAGDVGAVVLSHLHWDHALGLDENLFPNASIYIQREEIRYAAAPYGPHAPFYDPVSVKKLLPTFASSYPKVVVIDGDFRPFDGLRILHLPGHTPGLQGVVVESASGRHVMASDTIPFASSWRGPTPADWIPEGIHVSIDDCYRSMARVALEEGEVVPSHDPSIFSGRDT
jgi:N-acyl homoserine lactone hydrolase